MKIIELENEFTNFISEFQNDPWVIVPVYSNGDVPVYVDTISLMYVYVLYKDEEAVFIFNHTEGLQLPEHLIDRLPNSNKMFVYGKKKFKSISNNSNLIDIDLIEYFYRNQPMEDDFDTPAHEFFTRTIYNFKNLNTIIPISKHIEKSQSITRRFLEVYETFHDNEAFDMYNNLIIDNLFQIEKTGLYVNKDEFFAKFANKSVFNGYVYSEYNIYTTTGRPSNRFGHVNFAALNKENGERSVFTSRFGKNGFLMSFDYDAYHLRLLAFLVDYAFPENVSVHEYLGTFYFGKSELTHDEYVESKSISFRQLYGGIQKEYLEIPFFEKIDEYTKLLWKKFQDDGYIETPLFHRRLFKSFFTDMNAAKLLNYILQAFETERNMAVIQAIHEFKQSFASELILYTYDSFLLDFNINDGASVVRKIKDILEQNGHFPVKIEIGTDYQHMKSVKITT